METDLQTVGTVATALIAVLHIYIMVLEMFLWDRPKGKKVFGLTQEFATATKTLAANQGLYNGFLSAGLIWGILLGVEGNPVKIFFLACVVTAGIFGAITSSKKILFVQGIPGAIALVLVLLAN